MDMDNVKFGQFIAKLRKEKNMTQKQLAEKLHLTDKAISKWERGLSFPDIATLKPLSELFDVSITELLSGEQDDKKEVNIDEKVLEILKQVELQKRKKLKKMILIGLAIILILCSLFFLSVFCKIKFHTYNPIRALIGYIEVEAFGKEYAQVATLPTKTIYAKEEFDFNQYMANRGFTEIKEEQMGCQRVFTNGEIKEYILHWTMLDGYPFMILEWENIIPDNSKKIIEENKEQLNENSLQNPIIKIETNELIKNITD
jgi:hypothetical protein